MATLYVENVPDELYKALRKRARQRRRSIAAEIITLLEENYPTEAELQARAEWIDRLERLRRKKPRARGPFPSTEEMLREDRSR